jgi:hypothetical protein
MGEDPPDEPCSERPACAREEADGAPYADLVEVDSGGHVGFSLWYEQNPAGFPYFLLYHVRPSKPRSVDNRTRLPLQRTIARDHCTNRIFQRATIQISSHSSNSPTLLSLQPMVCQDSAMRRWDRYDYIGAALLAFIVALWVIHFLLPTPPPSVP